MNRKKRIFDGIRIIALLFFVGVLLYPAVSDYLSRIHSSKVIQSYEKSIVGLDQETKNKMLQEAQAYNSSLIGKGELYDPFMSIEKVDKYYMSLLNSNGDGVMGYIQIPRIDVKLPIYHTTSDKVLQKGSDIYKELLYRLGVRVPMWLYQVIEACQAPVCLRI